MSDSEGLESDSTADSESALNDRDVGDISDKDFESETVEGTLNGNDKVVNTSLKQINKMFMQLSYPTVCCNSHNGKVSVLRISTTVIGTQPRFRLSQYRQDPCQQLLEDRG